MVYCSPITATLLIKDMGMPAERVIPLPVDEPHVIDGVTVTLMDANHCPGACMMLFKVPVKGSKPQVTFHISSAVVVSVTLEGAVATVASAADVWLAFGN